MTDAIADKAETDPVWAEARDRYEDGETGAAIMADLGLAPSTFWSRRSAGKWARAERPRAATPPLDRTAPSASADEAIDLAWRRLCHALEVGSSSDAARWSRVHAGLMAERRAQARDEAEARTQAKVQTKAQADAARRAMGLPPFEDGLDVEKVESKKSDSTASPAAPDPDAPGLSRAERRRRLKYLAKRR